MSEEWQTPRAVFNSKHAPLSADGYKGCPWLLVHPPREGAPKGQQAGDLAGSGSGTGEDTAGAQIGPERAQWALFREVEGRLGEISTREMAAILGLLFDEWARRDKEECEKRQEEIATEGTESTERRDS